MSECENLEKCPIFKKFKKEDIANYWINMYCKGKHEKCKRKELKNQRLDVPISMLPNGTLSLKIKR